MKRIKLTQGKFALVSDIDYAYLNQFRWYYNGRYATRAIYISGVRQGRTTHMHRLVLERMGCTDFKYSDHKNRNRLDNRRCNLRPATQQQNSFNQIKHTDNTSGYKGVDFHEGRWRARIMVNGYRECLGHFTNKLEAAKAYNKAAKKYFGKFARLNEI